VSGTIGLKTARSFAACMDAIKMTMTTADQPTSSAAPSENESKAIGTRSGSSGRFPM